MDVEGGAARGAYRLHQGLKRAGEESSMLVMQKRSDDFTVLGPRSNSRKLLSILRPYIDSLPVYLYRPKVKPVWTTNWLPNNILPYIREAAPDIVQMRWIGGGFLNLSILSKIGLPMVWTLPDSWAFTGGCHVPFECKRYEVACGRCPQLDSARDHDLSRCIHRKKMRIYKSLRDLTVVAPSRWLSDCAKRSSLLGGFRMETIPNGIDTSVFRPRDKELSRELLCLPRGKKLILFGAVGATSDRNKGFHLLQPALKRLSREIEDAEVVVFGATEPREPPDMGFPSRYMGYLYDDVSLSLLYSASDVMVVPSMQENFPLTALEAQACGTPVVAFRATGMPDVVDDRATGCLAEPYEPEDLAKGMEWVLQDEGRLAELSRKSRKKVEEEFKLELQARRYVDLYQDILGRK